MFGFVQEGLIIHLPRNDTRFVADCAHFIFRYSCEDVATHRIVCCRCGPKINNYYGNPPQKAAAHGVEDSASTLLGYLWSVNF